jgi:hypothetical protein
MANWQDCRPAFHGNKTRPGGALFQPGDCLLAFPRPFPDDEIERLPVRRRFHMARGFSGSLPLFDHRDFPFRSLWAVALVTRPAAVSGGTSRKAPPRVPNQMGAKTRRQKQGLAVPTCCPSGVW